MRMNTSVVGQDILAQCGAKYCVFIVQDCPFQPRLSATRSHPQSWVYQWGWTTAQRIEPSFVLLKRMCWHNVGQSIARTSAIIRTWNALMTNRWVLVL
jgi:hypothetical protein